VGGAAALTARRVAAVEDVHFLDEFGPTEAVWTLRMDGLEAIVGMDAHGESLFDRVRTASENAVHAFGTKQKE
jgi:tartrate dehydratase beta subunit/fumarate hydratase class I family protein